MTEYLKKAGFIVMVLALTSIFLAAGGPDVKITGVAGDVKVLKDGKTEWIGAGVGMSLQTGDRIKTSADSSAELSFGRGSGNIVRVTENTDAFIRLKGDEKIELVDGEVLALVKKIPRGERFEIRTPAAVCGARGTGFGSKHKNNKTDVSAYENKSYVKGIGKDGKTMDEEFDINQGFKRSVDKFGVPSGMQKLADRDLDKWNAWKEDRAAGQSGGGAGSRDTHRADKFSESLERTLQRKEDIYEKSDRARIMEKMQERREETCTSSGSYMTKE